MCSHTVLTSSLTLNSRRMNAITAVCKQEAKMKAELDLMRGAKDIKKGVSAYAGQERKTEAVVGCRLVSQGELETEVVKKTELFNS